jgi:cysteine-rich repeat protein
MRLGLIGLCLLAVVTSSLLAQDATVGDCDGSQIVEVNELVLGIRIVLGRRPLCDCPSLDVDMDGRASVDELIAAVVDALTPPVVCGNGILNRDEQCDDADRISGDGCRATCRLEGLGQLDEHWLGIPAGCFGFGGQISIEALAPLGQEFRPTLPSITAVSIHLAADREHAVGIHLMLREASIHGPVIATVDGVTDLSVSGAGWHRFDLAEPLEVTPGAVYVIELASDANLLWMSSVGGDDCPNLRYDNGMRIVQGELSAGEDFHFAIFGSP